MKNAKSWLAGLLLAGSAWTVSATEGGGGAYPNGAEGFLTGALPPPGQYLINYSMYYSADSFKDARGDTLPIDFDLAAVADTIRLVNVTPLTVLGGSWAQHIFVPLVFLDVGVSPAPGVRAKDTNFGMGDLIVDPFILGWHKPPFHWVVGIDTYVPVGKYHEGSLANLGRNYWTFEPAAAVTYWNEGGQEVSAKLMYDFNTKNPDTDYLSGQECHTDLAVAQHCGNWAFGLGGYWYAQTTDDRQFGSAVGGGNRGRQVAIGPQCSYQCGPVNLSLVAEREFLTENRPQGDKVWLRAVLPL
jgi:hypothetical protein